MLSFDIGTEAAERPAIEERAPSKILDLAHLQRYTLGDVDLQREVLELFRAQAVRGLDELRASCDPQSWRFHTHTLKGSARAVGAFRLADAALAAERVDAQADGDARGAAILRLEAAVRETTAAIAAL